MADDPSLPLQERPFRSVRLRPEDGGVVCKSWHHPGRLQALFDGRRARQEHHLLTELHRRGLPVPRPLGLGRRDGAHELRMEAIRGARTLDELLGHDAQLSTERLEELARTLVAFQEAGLRHPDLHPGNVLLDADGRPFLVDFQGARLVRSVSPRAAEDDLVTLAAATRERLPVRPRQRFLVAWARSRGLDERAALGARVEGRARIRRRAVVLRGLGRWLRDSSRARLGSDGEVTARDAGAPPTREIAGPLRHRRALWLAAARLVEHRLPAPHPVRHGPRATHLERADPGTPFDARTAEPPRLRQAGRLLAALHDRGLDLARGELAEAFVEHGDGLWVRPEAALRARDRGPDGPRLRDLEPARADDLRAGYFG